MSWAAEVASREACPRRFFDDRGEIPDARVGEAGLLRCQEEVRPIGVTRLSNSTSAGMCSAVRPGTRATPTPRERDAAPLALR
jgi:hypothetical protein